MELVDIGDSKSPAFGCGGSSPPTGTKSKEAHLSVGFLFPNLSLYYPERYLSIFIKERTMANHYETSPPMFRNAPLKFILYLLLIPVFGLGLFLLLWWYIDNKNKLLSIEGDLMKWQ